jgi:Mn2+/Fe2+ NRAMP family transporter
VAGVLLVSVVVVNVVTISADLQAGAAGIGLLAGVDPRWPVLPLGLALAGLLLIGKYDEVVAVLRYLLLGFLAFVVAAVLAQPDWPSLLKGSLMPALPLRASTLAGALALLGTTVTSYVYVWETIERGIEDALDGSPLDSRLARARVGTVAGAVLTAAVLWSMLVTAAATLGRRHQTAATARQAAQELRPLAGSLATDLFAVGLITSAVVALPVLMATTAYVVGA